MPWRGPSEAGEYPTLGWLILDWAYAFLPAPDDETKPFVCTDEQARLLIDWYRLDERGRYVYRRGCSRRSKGWGKSPLEALKALAEFAGPVVFAGWDANGEPVGRQWGTAGDPPPWVQIAAVSEDQTENTYGTLYSLLTANEAKAAGELGIDEGRTRLYLRGRPGRLEPVTASAGTREGQRVTYAVLDETHLWTSRNGGVKLARTLRRNVAKMRGRSYETTNSFAPAEGSVAESTHKAAESGEPGIFYDAVEAPRVTPDDSDETLEAALRVAYGDASWIDLRRLVREIRDPDTPWEDAERFFFNHNVSGSGRAVDPARWQELASAREIPEGAVIALGFDGSISEDSTVLRACTPDGYSWLVGIWERPLGPAGKDWRVPRLEVDATVRETFARYRVGRMLCDPPRWRSEIEAWAAAYGDEVVLFFDTNQDRRMAPAVDRWLTAIREGSHTHDGDPVTSQHVANAHLRKAKATAPEDDARTLYTIVKGEDRRKIDAAVADVLALEAAATMPALEEASAPTVSFI